MCKLCELRENIGAAFLDMTKDLAETFDKFGDAMSLIERLHAKGVAFDTDEQRCYDGLRAYLGIDLAPAQRAEPATAAVITPEQRSQIAKHVSETYGVPLDSIIVCDSPEQAEAAMQKAIADKQGHKPN